MTKEISKTIPDQLLSFLTGEKLVTLVTINKDGTAKANAITWCIANDATTIMLAVDEQCTIVRNIQANPNVLLTIYGPNSVYSIAGEAIDVGETIEVQKYKASVIKVSVTQVSDIMFFSGELTKPLEFTKDYTYDEAIYNGLKK